MIRALVGRGLIIICFILALSSPAVPVFGYVVAGLLAVAFFCCATSQRQIWTDGWHAAHDHHTIEDGDTHLADYQAYLARQPWMTHD